MSRPRNQILPFLLNERTAAARRRYLDAFGNAANFASGNRFFLALTMRAGLAARRPEVFVRPLTMEEGRKLKRITRNAKDPIKLRRAIVVIMSGQGQSVPDITSLMQVSDDYVRDVIHAFNERGFDALDPNWSGAVHRRSVSGCVSTSA
ncbi:hypothetical protein GCM10010176_107120 [Nonomuraea spiralis]|nr:hypothetical protein GCM10010176_107120 [Nonomuraea spiralis]